MKQTSLWYGALAFIAAAAAAGAASAEVTTIGRFGFWEVVSGQVADGSTVCGVSTSFRGTDTKYLAVKWYSNATPLVVQLIKNSWKIPPNTQAPVAISMDGDSWNAVAKTGVNPQTLEFYVTPNKVRAFIHSLTASKQMQVMFTGGNEPPWFINLAGDTPAVNMMVKCVLALGPNDETNVFAYARTPLPFGAPQGATQPFGAPSTSAPAPQPSQPFGGPAQPSVVPAPVAPVPLGSPPVSTPRNQDVLFQKIAVEGNR
jgi:hypothetical protein